MSGLVVEHRESQFSRWLRRRRVQLAVGLAAVEAVLVVAGVLPWWLVVVAAAGSVALYLWRRPGSRLARRSRGDVARRRLAADRRARTRRLVVVGVLAIVVVALLAAVALTVLLLDRR